MVYNVVVNIYFVKSSQVVTGGDKKRLIDTGMVEIVSNSCYERRHYFERCQKVLNL